MKKDLGFLKVPFTGPFPAHIIALALVWGAVLPHVVFTSSVDRAMGPALSGELSDIPNKCTPIAVITVLWSLLYYNFMGIQSSSTGSFIFEILKPEDVTDQFGKVSSRIVGNTLEQSPVFLSSFWLYALFVDYGTAVPLGYLYLAARLMYAPFYFIPGEFTALVFFATFPMYAVNGIFMLGVLTNGLFNGNWLDWISSYTVSPSLYGYILGLSTMFPGLPLGPIFAAIHYHSHMRWNAANSKKFASGKATFDKKRAEKNVSTGKAA